MLQLRDITKPKSKEYPEETFRELIFLDEKRGNNPIKCLSKWSLKLSFRLISRTLESTDLRYQYRIVCFWGCMTKYEMNLKKQFLDDLKWFSILIFLIFI